MKEFSAQTGGRYTYVDDILNLQNLALAFTSIFNDCDNFIVSGCKVTGNSISDGYVFMNGKLRHFQGASRITSWPQYIYESNSTETVAYQNGADKVGRNIYGCNIAKTVPTTLDPLTNAIPQYIFIGSNGGKQLKDALFGKYSLTLESASGKQTVKGAVNFTGDVNVSNALSVENRLTIKTGNASGQMYYENNDFVVQSKIGDGDTYKFIVSNNSGFKLYINNQIIWEATGEYISNKVHLTGNTCRFGNIKTTGNNIYNDSVSADTGAIYINYLGHNGGYNYFRDTCIGNGKGGIIVEIKGKDSSVNMSGKLSISSANSVGIILKSSYSKSSNLLRKTISWLDSANNEIGHIGYNSIENNVFEVRNSLADISISGLSAVNLGPAIMENGVLLSEKYASLTYVKEKLDLKANSNEVYSSSDADKTFAKKSDGFSQFVSEKSSKEVLRSQIDAMSLSEAQKKMPSLDQFLSDMATTEEHKRKICDNIGAIYGEDYQKKLKDTGWIEVLTGLYIRQIGNMVSIQGNITLIHDGTIFTIPNQIDPPTYAVNYSTIANSYSAAWRCHIDSKSRKCIVDYCVSHNVRMPFSITYMV